MNTEEQKEILHKWWYSETRTYEQAVHIIDSLLSQYKQQLVDKVTRVEVIDHTLPESDSGRVFQKRDDQMKVELSIQEKFFYLKENLMDKQDFDKGLKVMWQNKSDEIATAILEDHIQTATKYMSQPSTQKEESLEPCTHCNTMKHIVANGICSECALDKLGEMYVIHQACREIVTDLEALIVGKDEFLDRIGYADIRELIEKYKNKR